MTATKVMDNELRFLLGTSLLLRLWIYVLGYIIPIKLCIWITIVLVVYYYGLVTWTSMWGPYSINDTMIRVGVGLVFAAITGAIGYFLMRFVMQHTMMWDGIHYMIGRPIHHKNTTVGFMFATHFLTFVLTMLILTIVRFIQHFLIAFAQIINAGLITLWS